MSESAGSEISAQNSNNRANSPAVVTDDGSIASTDYDSDLTLTSSVIEDFMNNKSMSESTVDTTLSSNTDSTNIDFNKPPSNAEIMQLYDELDNMVPDKGEGVIKVENASYDKSSFLRPQNENLQNTNNKNPNKQEVKNNSKNNKSKRKSI
ncbi:hypothetical protein [Ascidiimonas sp. W6]|uniref:hypothetical protein n=1 Tax=Ascidiimonas meishanensis TaxID=3128903 RepID=UPI0030EF286F